MAVHIHTRQGWYPRATWGTLARHEEPPRLGRCRCPDTHRVQQSDTHNATTSQRHTGHRRDPEPDTIGGRRRDEHTHT